MSISDRETYRQRDLHTQRRTDRENSQIYVQKERTVRYTYRERETYSLTDRETEKRRDELKLT